MIACRSLDRISLALVEFRMRAYEGQDKLQPLLQADRWFPTNELLGSRRVRDQLENFALFRSLSFAGFDNGFALAGKVLKNLRHPAYADSPAGTEVHHLAYGLFTPGDTTEPFAGIGDVCEISNWIETAEAQFRPTPK